MGIIDEAIKQQETAKAIAAEQAKKADDLEAFIQLTRQQEEMARRLGLSQLNQTEQGTALDKELPAQIKQNESGKAPKAATFREKVKEIARREIGTYGSISTKVLIEKIEADGVQFAAQNRPVAVAQALAAYRDEFKPDRKRGWTLIPKKNEAFGESVNGNSQAESLSVQHSPLAGAQQRLEEA
jgi:hypothetical protein